MIVVAVFLLLVVTAGLGFDIASVSLEAAVEEYDASVSAVSVATALFFGVSGVVGFTLARQMDRFDLRWFSALGGRAALSTLAFASVVGRLAGGVLVVKVATWQRSPAVAPPR